MAREKQISANRANAKKSTGPRTVAGRDRSSRNAYRHGLSLPMPPDPKVVEALAQAIVGETAGEIQLRAARALAEAQLELRRVRATRVATMSSDLDQTLNLRRLADLCAFDRYELQVASRRRAALRWLNEIASSRE